VSEKNIYQRINAVMNLCEYVQKSGAAQGKGVKYDEVIPMIRGHMISEGIAIVVRQLNMETVSEVKNQKVYQGHFEMDLVNIDKPEDKVTHSTFAQGMDGGDKGPGKANTYAVKVMLVKAFMIESGDDEESRSEQAASYSKPIKAQFDEIFENEHPLDMFVFAQQVGPDTYTALYNSFKKGEIVANKKLCDKLTADGSDVIQNISDQIGEHISNEDPAWQELVSELVGFEKTLVWGLLSDDHKNYIRENMNNE